MFASILDTGHALPDRTRGRGSESSGATTHSSHELSSQSAQIPDLESDSDSDLDSASDALASCVEVVGIMTTLGWQLARSRAHKGGRVGVTIAACQLQRRRPRLALSARALAEFALELGSRWSCKCVCIWHMTLYIPQAKSPCVFPLPLPLLCLSVHRGDLLNTRKVP